MPREIFFRGFGVRSGAWSENGANPLGFCSIRPHHESQLIDSQQYFWSGKEDSNLQPLRPERSTLPG